MAFLLLNIFFTFLFVGFVVASHATVEPSEVYWKSVLPNTPIPKALKDLVHPSEWEAKFAIKGKVVDYGESKIKFSYPFKPNTKEQAANVGGKPIDYGERKYSFSYSYKPRQAANVGGNAIDYKESKLRFSYPFKPNTKEQAANVEEKPIDYKESKKIKFSYPFKPNTKEQAANVGEKPIDYEESKNIKFSYPFKPNTNEQAANIGDKNEVQDFNSKAATLFFLEKDLLKGTKKNLPFAKTTTPLATFLPLQVANKIPFSSNKFPEILKYFALEPTAVEARIMKDTINECERAAIKGEEKKCATSLESMIDFSISNLGEKVIAISTEAEKESDNLQEYTVVSVKKIGGSKAVACHKQNYLYAVFYCHSTLNTKAYTISLIGKGGAKVKAVAVCHTDTKEWDADYIAFKVLNVKPGTIPICHFLPEDHVIWVTY